GTAARVECTGGHDHQTVHGQRTDDADDGFLAVMGEQAGEVPVRDERGNACHWEQTDPAEQDPTPAFGPDVPDEDLDRDEQEHWPDDGPDHGSDLRTPAERRAVGRQETVGNVRGNRNSTAADSTGVRPTPAGLLDTGH